MHGRRSARVRGVVVIVALVGVMGLLAGCTTPDTPVSPETTAAAPALAPSPSATPTAPTFVAEGDADANMAYFVSVSQAVLAGKPDAGGRDFIDQLVAAGFDKSRMEVTPDTTAVGLEADNVQFSVNLNGSCLVGQSGNVGFHAFTTTEMSTGTCLIGKTRAIDW